jgi:thiamine biosynthesis protein ThiS
MKMAVLKINGRQTKFDDKLPETLAELLEKLNVKADTIVAEIDGQIIERENFAATQLQHGQSIELVRFVPGG